MISFSQKLAFSLECILWLFSRPFASQRELLSSACLSDSVAGQKARKWTTKRQKVLRLCNTARRKMVSKWIAKWKHFIRFPIRLYLICDSLPFSNTPSRQFSKVPFHAHIPSWIYGLNGSVPLDFAWDSNANGLMKNGDSHALLRPTKPSLFVALSVPTFFILPGVMRPDGSLRESLSIRWIRHENRELKAFICLAKCSIWQ